MSKPVSSDTKRCKIEDKDRTLQHKMEDECFIY
jgi:hypothetical protein